MGCVGDGLTCTEHQVSICAKDSGGPYHYDVVTDLVKAGKEAGVDYAIDVYSGRYDQNYDCSDRGTDIEKKITAGRNIGKIKRNSGNK